MAQSNDVFDSNGRIHEDYVQNAFHSYLKSSLAQAKAERLVDVQMLSSAEGDLMVTGKSLYNLNHRNPPISTCIARSTDLNVGTTRPGSVSLLCCTSLYDEPTLGPTPAP
jgi:hypothetical protein